MRGRVAAFFVAVVVAAPASAQITESVVQRMEGIWGNADCSVAAPITVFGDKIQFQWPGRDKVVEEVTFVAGNRVSTSLVSPAARRGERHEYEIGADRMLIRTLATGRESILVRCARPSG
jgi:hypothetical protein